MKRPPRVKEKIVKPRHTFIGPRNVVNLSLVPRDDVAWEYVN